MNFIKNGSKNFLAVLFKLWECMRLMQKKNKTYSKNDVCAVIVTYNPDNTLKENIKALVPQVDQCLIVDNGSKNIKCIKSIIANLKIVLIELGTNMGIAYALNKGLDYCKKNHYPLILTMDQDTILDSHCVDILLNTMNKTNSYSVGINWDRKIDKSRQVDYLITSGNLNVGVAKSVGGYDDKLFIDSVDFDFSLKLQNRGFKLIKVAKAFASHQLGIKQGKYSAHSVERYYYIFRNHFYLIHKYWKRNKLFCIKKEISLIYEIFRMILYDKECYQKLKIIKDSYKDYIRIRDK